MEITVLGSARQVGRSAFLVRGKQSRLLLDFGVMTLREPAFPIHVKPRDVDAILLTHAHLDHSGATPLFFTSEGVDLYATSPTFDLTEILIEDFLKISGPYLPFEYIDLLSMLKRAHRLERDQEIQVGEFKVTFWDAGHIPGSSSIILDDGRRRLLYTGDINTSDTCLLGGADADFGEPDFIITESTYAMVDHPSREEVERDFVEFAKEVVERGGTLLVPAFSVGRAQEMACILRSSNFPYPVAMDGMALKTNKILARHPEYLRDPVLFRESIESAELITSWSQRRKIVSTPSVIISPAGMLLGGAAVFYSNQVAREPRNAIAIVSFQVPGTPGKTLLEKGIILVNGRPTKVKAEVRRFDFSSHCGRKELFDIFRRIGGGPTVLTVHGEEESCVKFAEELGKEGFKAQAPRAGERFTI